MAEYLAPECVKDNPNTSYDLIANICYEGQTGWIFDFLNRQLSSPLSEKTSQSLGLHL